VISKKFLIALVTAATLAGCGGGEDSNTALSPETVSVTMQSQAQSQSSLPARQDAVSPEAAANQMLDFAESTFPQFFPTRTANSVLGPLVFRYYPQTQIYLGVGVSGGGGVVAGNVYVMGGLFGSRPIDVGPLTNFITPTAAVVTPTLGDKNLIITVNVSGVSQTINVGNMPMPTTQAEFCDGLAADTTFSGIGAGAGAGGQMVINSCSFSGNSGQIAATLTITSPYPFTMPYSITYTYQ